jgi:hypothetical protein
MKSTASSISKAVSSSPVNVPTEANFMKSTASSVGKVIASSSPVNVPQDAKIDREEMLEKLMNNVIRFTRSRYVTHDIGQDNCSHERVQYTHDSFCRSDRRMLLRTFKDCTYLQHIPVDHTNSMVAVPSTDAEWKELELEVAASIPIEVNGVMLGAGVDEKNKKYEGKKLLQLLYLLCNKLTHGLTKKSDSDKQVNSYELYRALLVRLSPKNTAGTAYFLVNSLIGSKELVLQVPKKPIKAPRITSLVVYVSDDAVHGIVEHENSYGLFRKSDSAGKPWIGLTAGSHERVNLSTGKSVRRLAVHIHEERFSVFY